MIVAVPSRPVPADRGSATVLVVASMAVLVTVTATLVGAAAVRVGAVRASGAADAGALAAAAALVALVDGEPCDAAARVVAADRADLDRCDLDGASAVVAVRLRIGPVGLTASARAGPGSDPDPPFAHGGTPRTHMGRGARYEGGTSCSAGSPAAVCMVCLSARRSSMSRSTRALPCPRADSTIDQGVTCQARRSS